jgi:Family of unknown function (DUF5335)
MPTTRQIPLEECGNYFEDLNRRLSAEPVPCAVTIELLGYDIGDQLQVEKVRLSTITFDASDQSLRVVLEDLEHRIPLPDELWVIEEEETGLPSALELAFHSGRREIIYFRPEAAQDPYQPTQSP